MDVVDPKDMTASELLRWAANGEPYSNGLDDHTWNNPTGKIKALAEAVTGEWPVDLEAFSHIADKIDAELAQARELSLLQGAAIWAKANGWPDIKEGEDFTEWMNRCWLPIPRYEDGEPVHEGSETRYGTVSFVDVEVSNGGWGNWVMHMEDGECVEGTLSQRVERPEPKAIDADGAETRRGKQDASDYIDENIGLYRDLIEAEMESAHGDWGCRYD